MSRPIPISVTKSPLPEDESNLGALSADVGNMLGNSVGSLFPLAAWPARVLQPSSVGNRDFLAPGRLWAGARDVGCSCHAHGSGDVDVDADADVVESICGCCPVVSGAKWWGRDSHAVPCLCRASVAKYVGNPG
jgi:hypothetical protein